LPWAREYPRPGRSFQAAGRGSCAF
jgi:hypothetical protein